MAEWRDTNHRTVYELWPETRNKLHGPMHCKIGVTCVFNGHVFNNLLEKKHNNLIHLFQNSAVLVMNSQVFGQCSYTIHAFYIVLKCSNVNIHKA